MAGKIVALIDAHDLAQSLHTQGKKIILVGGCFDILHIGHIDFLEKAKALGDSVVVLLESDATLRKLKGANRPIHLQNDRARILAALHLVDAILLLPPLFTDSSYDEVILDLKPAIIATTIGDAGREHKDRQAKMIGAQLVEIPKVKNLSTSHVAKYLETEL